MVLTDFFGFFLTFSSALFGAVSAATVNEVVNTDCGGVRPIHSTPHSHVGFIGSPNHPHKYPAENMQCTFKFLPNPDEQVQLAFSYFTLRESQKVPAITNCDLSDSVKIFIGTSHENSNPGNQVGEYCGGRGPEPVMAVGRPLTVVFTVRTKENPDVGATVRFKAKYTFSKDYGFKTHAAQNHTAGVGCHFIFDGRRGPEQGVFDSPNFGGLYPYGTNCIYTFQAFGNQSIRLNFDRFDVEGHHDCRRSEDDFVYITEGKLPRSAFATSAEDDPIKRDPNAVLYCGLNHPKSPAFYSNKLKTVVNVIFKSGQHRTRHGFRGTYSFEGHPYERIPINRSSRFSQYCSIPAMLFGMLAILLRT